MPSSYVRMLLYQSITTRALRSSASKLLQVTRTNLRSGSRSVITARCTIIVQSGVLRLHVVHLSVRLSVCPSVTLVDQDYIGWQSWKLIARTISPTSSLFVAQRPSTYSKGTWENLGETRGGVGKSGVLEHKSGNISETRKDRGKYTMKGL